ncbi:hypothetical protein D9V32_15970 [Mycetocola tolaasinivorans]|uniref:Lipoprotein n=1 Tax=Mycetocola tolaasinivorans TaxID=76635 RepID=A0A3L6ZXI9_9MICO|nr:hypothetical protein [Mycetocola tolaasinivorans]RLP71852.1 hypothetical protein D9V32_15970 [Mycetocola tolaasinivorans]
MSARKFAAATALVVVLGLSACSAEQTASSGPYAAQFEQARKGAVTDFQREVLKDNVITDDEFRETRERYIRCLADAGIKAVANPDGSYDLASAPSAAEEVAERRCTDETTGSIEALYNSMRSNPKNEDLSAMIPDCLRAQGVVDAAFTNENWEQFVRAFSTAQNAARNPDGSYPLNADIPNLPTLPGGIAMDDPRVQQCGNSPLSK